MSNNLLITQLDPNPAVNALRRLANMLEKGELVHKSGGMIFDGDELHELTVSSNLVLVHSTAGRLGRETGRKGE